MNTTIIDYGLGNLYSLERALKHLGSEVSITKNSKGIFNAESLILPGVGAFGVGMKHLRSNGLIKPIISHVEDNKPLLGICLGMQLLLNSSEEMGTHVGLSLINGDVLKLSRYINDQKYKIPHVGWGELKMPKEFTWDESILQGLKNGDSVYFVHSYAAVPFNKQNILATTEYGEHQFCSVIRRNNLYGCQFHPEKSGEIGLKILGNFLNINK